MSSNLTLKDVALAAGVSEMTASRALRNASDVSNTTRQKVMDTAAALGYVPNSCLLYTSPSPRDS